MCLAHIYATAGMARVAFTVQLHDYGVDGHFQAIVQRGDNLIPSGFPLDYQAKATVDWELEGDFIVYDLDARAYNNIVSRPPAATTMILILLCLPKNGILWHEASLEETVMRHCCYYFLPEGDVTDNKSSKRIRIPRTNMLTPAMLKDLLDLERVRREG